MVLFALLLALAAVVVEPGSAAALELVWSSGCHDIIVRSAVRCTLMVRASGGETLPNEWHVVYVAEGGAVQLIADSDNSGAAVAGACAIGGSRDLADVLGQVDTVRHCLRAQRSARAQVA